MAPSFTLRGISPARANLTIPQASSRPTSSPGSPASSPARSNPPSPSGSAASGDKEGYFPPANRAPPTQISRDEAFKTAKAVEGVLTAWNEYRMAVGALTKAGKKMANAIKDLVGMMDKTEIPSQTLRPTSSMMENISDVTGKLGRKMDKEYDEVNGDASKYFTLLAKESRTHEAYLGAIGKKHDKAEKAYRKAAKNLSDTSGAHAGLLALKDSLGQDISRAQNDHMSLLGNKQAVLLLRLASSASVLATTMTSFFSEGLRRSGAVCKDIEYFGVLADIKWQGQHPSDLDDAAETEKRDEIRLLKARVALGEMDMIGPQVWQESVGDGRSRETSVNRMVGVPSPKLDQTVSHDGRKVPEIQGSPIPDDGVSAEAGKNTRDSKAESIKQIEESAPSRPDAAVKESAQGVVSAQAAKATDQVAGTEARARPSLRSEFSNLPSSASSLTGSRTSSHEAENPSTAWTSPTHSQSQSSGDGMSGQVSRDRRYDESKARTEHHFAQQASGKGPASSFNPHGISETSYPEPRVPAYASIGTRPTHNARSSSIAVPGFQRSVSQIAADMEERARAQREAAFREHQSHVSGYVRHCQLCNMDYDRVLGYSERPLPPVDLRNFRRVTMPPAYMQPEASYLPSGAGRPSHHLGEMEWGNSRSITYNGVIAAPRPFRPVRLTPEFEEYENHT